MLLLSRPEMWRRSKVANIQRTNRAGNEACVKIILTFVELDAGTNRPQTTSCQYPKRSPAGTIVVSNLVTKCIRRSNHVKKL